MKEVIKELKELEAKKVFVQFPEGLTLRIQEIAKDLEKNGFQVVVCIEKCFGACDIRENEARLLGCDTILHIGHEKFFESKLPVVFWEYFIDVDPLPILKKEVDKLKDYKKIGLVTSIQFVKTIPIVKKFLEENGKKVFVHKSLQHAGQVLGCNLEAAKAVEKEVDCFLCISAGEFYAAGIVTITGKPVLSLDLERKEIYSLEDFRKKLQKIIAWNKAQLKDAKKVGILTSWKKGQMCDDSFRLKKSLEMEKKEVFVFAMDEITPEKLEGLKLDFLINCACPRIGLDDISRYKIPLVNIDQLKE
jgi:2-(3-amino-3-carboxypropyl)histidine synthase